MELIHAVRVKTRETTLRDRPCFECGHTHLSNVVRSNVHAAIKEATVEGKTVRFKGQFGMLG